MTFDNEGKASRRLPYPLNESLNPDYAENQTGDIAHVTPDLFPIEPDEQIEIVLQMSYNEYTALASAIDVGRDIIQGENSVKLWWTWVRSLRGVPTLNCDDVADCIDTSEAVQQSIVNNNIANGFTTNPATATASQVTPIPQAQQDANAIADTYDCAEPDKNMAIARAIVRELNEGITDILQEIELATNAVEAANIATDGTPILGTLNNVTELGDWYLETLTELYTASYTQAAEDTIACAIFCHLQETCSISLNELISIYEAVGGQVPDNIDDLQAAITETINFTLNVSIATVATAHCMVLWLMRFGSQAFGLGGWNTIANTIQTAATYQDFSYDVCEDCPPEETPTTYWRLYLDFRISKWDSVPVVWNGAPNDGSWVGNGWQYNPTTASTTNVSFGIPDLGGAFTIKAIASQSVRRGSDGNGSNDVAQHLAYPNANFTGTVANWNVSGVTLNTNDVRAGVINSAAGGTYRSINIRGRVQEAANLGSAMLRIYSVVIWGIPNVGDVKPPHSEWAGNTLPTVVADLFPYPL